MSSGVGEKVGRAAVYAIYNVGLSVPVGLVRTVIALCFIAKHHFNSAMYEEANNAREQGRQGENLTAQKRTRQSKGFRKKVWNKGEELLTRGSNFLEGKVEKWGTIGIKTMEETQARAWNDELIRGVAEIFFIGGPIYTYRDYTSKPKVSLLGIGELAKKWQADSELDDLVNTALKWVS